QLTGKDIAFNSDNIAWFITASLVITVVTGLLAGSYPAFYLSSFQPAQVLKGKLNLGNSSGRLRQVLVVFQFVIAIVLVCGIFFISRQMDFMVKNDLGFDSQAIIVLPRRTSEARNNYDVLKIELQAASRIKSVSASRYVPGTF